MKLIFLVCFITLGVLGCAESAKDFAARASSQQSANNIEGAEATLQQGIERHPQDETLKKQLMKLYLDSRQEEKIRNYLGMAGNQLPGNVRSAARLQLGFIASDKGRSEAALREFLSSASEMRSYIEKYHDVAACADMGPSYGFAMRSATELKDPSKIRATINHFNDFKRNSFCGDEAEVARVAESFDQIAELLDQL
jgi:predicted Zn-dependent protease